LAWRNLKGSGLRSAFILGAISVSVATVTAVSHCAAAVRQTLANDAKSWLGGDIAVDTSEPISDAQIAAFDSMRSDGIAWTMATWVLTTAGSSDAPDPIYVTLKAVDPDQYPYYGASRLRPPVRLRDALAPDSVVVSESVLARLHVGIGDKIRIGRRAFTISASSLAEPERAFGVLGWGPRVTLSQAAFDQIGAAEAGNNSLNRIVLRLPSKVNARAAMDRLQAIVPEGRVLDYRDAARPEVTRVELAISFASISAFLVIALGAIGVGASVRLDLDQRIAALAMLRVLGARTVQIVSVFLIESAALIAAGLPFGILAGWAMGRVLISIAGRFLNLPPSEVHDPATLFASGFAGLAMAAPLLAAPLNAIARLRPMVLARIDFPESRPPLPLARMLLATTITIAGASAVAIAYLLIRARMPALMLGSGVLMAAGVAWILSRAALAGVKRWIASKRCPPVLKRSLAGFYRPGNRPELLVACLALGVMAIGATFQNNRAIVNSVANALPYPRANLLIAGFDAAHREAVRGFVESQRGVESVEMSTEVWLRLVAIDGRTVPSESYLGKCVENGSGSAVIANDLASRLGVLVGTRLDFELRDGIVSTTVGEIRSPPPDERFWLTFIVGCNALPRSAWIEAAAVHVKDDDLEALRLALAAKMPTLAAIPSNEIRATIESVTGDALALAPMTVWPVSVGVVLILISLIAVSRAARSKEIAILAALGATRKTVAQLFTIEFATVGILAAVIGSVLGVLFSALVFRILFYRNEIAIDGKTALIALALCPLITIAAGWLPLYRLLRQRPLEILRHE
jgi:putative ABC transport system permease protein